MNTTKVQSASYAHPVVPGACFDRCRAARASVRLYGEPEHPVSVSQVEKQARIDALSSVAATQLAAYKPAEPTPPDPRTEIVDRFRIQYLTNENQSAVRSVEALFLDTARVLAGRLPHGRSKALALTALEEAEMHALKAVAE